jgi:hypothetical protein
MWQGEQDSLTPITQEDAIEYFEGLEGLLTEHYVDYQEAFPDVVIEDA